jgi:hypothetical protein
LIIAHLFDKKQAISTKSIKIYPFDKFYRTMGKIEAPRPAQRQDGELYTYALSLFLFKAVATGAAIRRAVAGVPDVNFSQSTIVACAIVLTFGHAATDRSVDIRAFFVHHINIPPSKVKIV